MALLFSLSTSDEKTSRYLQTEQRSELLYRFWEMLDFDTDPKSETESVSDMEIDGKSILIFFLSFSFIYLFFSLEGKKTNSTQLKLKIN